MTGRWINPVVVAVLVVGLFGIAAMGAAAGGLFVDAEATIGPADAGQQPTLATQNGTAVSEEAAREPVPEPGDAYFEAEDSDGEWISYVNPRDGYRSPYLGEGSGKMCVALVNEAGEPIVGETIPNTTATIETGDELEWQDHGHPFVVEYPLPENYERPLDADQFGTSDELPQGDGYLDSHCVEWHGLPEDETVEYSPVELEGEHAEDLEVVGYIEQAHEDWDSDVDPIDDAEPYDAVGGEWTYREGGSHGQVVAVVQLDRDGELPETGVGSAANSTSDDSDGDDGTDSNANDDTASDADEAESIPGFGALVAVVAGTIAVAARIRD
ncbi:hypothetical protein [Halopiger goleimassiliensis]|uniref:hypothetical protein n=1 Tax=Halopiger goleimassiliensis TaxID=1293048 RepID=UPI000677903C|nr:hypothetical protein [Halopiger goleimassiliensis]